MNVKRCGRLIREIVNNLSLDLSGIRVLTEAASGPFAVTAPLAAVAGADRVVAVARNSAYGPAVGAIRQTREIADLLGCSAKIQFSEASAREFAHSVDLVTNLGFVRPIDDDFLARLPSGAAVSLMYEPWEFRGEDVDVKACRRRGIPIIGTNETHDQLEIFKYIGMLAVKLLMDRGIEVFRSKIIVVGSEPFGAQIEEVVSRLGSNCVRLDPLVHWPPMESELANLLRACDAIIVAEHRSSGIIIGSEGLSVDVLPDDIQIIHISGNVVVSELKRKKLEKHPLRCVSFGRMTVTAGYVGPKPVIDLHAGGLKAGAVLIREFRSSRNARESEKKAEKSGFGRRLG